MLQSISSPKTAPAPVLIYRDQLKAKKSSPSPREDTLESARGADSQHILPLSEQEVRRIEDQLLAIPVAQDRLRAFQTLSKQLLQQAQNNLQDALSPLKKPKEKALKKKSEKLSCWDFFAELGRCILKCLCLGCLLEKTENKPSHKEKKSVVTEKDFIPAHKAALHLLQTVRALCLISRKTLVGDDFAALGEHRLNRKLEKKWMLPHLFILQEAQGILRDAWTNYSNFIAENVISRMEEEYLSSSIDHVMQLLYQKYSRLHIQASLQPNLFMEEGHLEGRQYNRWEDFDQLIKSS